MPADSQEPAPEKTAAPVPPGLPPTPKLYRAIDWWTFGLTFLLIFIGYLLTLSPDLTLEDSGELAVGSMYAGVPHPPGYPVWTLFTFLFTKLLPFSNIAWRVGVSSAFSAAFACGLLALIVSRGSSMILEGIEDLKGIERRWENALCMVSGFVAAMLLGFNGFMWSQAVIVEVYPFSVLSLLITLCLLLRWMYAPHQMRYLYWAALVFGICITNHQTLLVAAMGLEVAVIAAKPKLGRDLLVINCLAWLVGILLKAKGMIHTFDTAPGSINMVFLIFNVVGGSSAVALGVLVARTKSIMTEWKAVILIGLLWIIGVSFYFYMPVASMSNPPMNWGYPRTVEGFFHAISRGQYEKTNPTNFITEPMRLVHQIRSYFEGAGEEFSWAYLLLALVPFFFYFKMKKRERAWMIGLFSIYLCLAFLLMILLNPNTDRATASLVKVFFTASYVSIAIWIGYGITLTGASLLAHFERARFWVLCGAGIGAAVSFISLITSINETFELDADGAFGGVKTLVYGIGHIFERGQGALPIWGALIVLILFLSLFAIVYAERTKVRFGVVLLIFALMPATSVVSHWFNNEQRGHLFGFWFGHDMFTPPFTEADGKTPLYPEMARDAVLFGGTDPGRFCPTYMIFCESFIPAECRRDPKFDRRDVYLITQNALADGTYLDYIRGHYNRSAQVDPPFFQNFLPHLSTNVFRQPTPGLVKLDEIFTKLGANIEKERRVGSAYFKESDFVNLPAFAAKLRSGPHQDVLSKFLYSKMSKETQSLLDGKSDDPALRRSLARDLNTILEKGCINDGQRFKNVKLPTLITRALAEMTQLTNAPIASVNGAAVENTMIRLNRRMLEEAYPELAKSPGGVFPDTEIHTPSPAESKMCFNEYMMGVQRRMEHDQRYPNEPKQIKPGEMVQVSGDAFQVAGQVSVMSINGLLTKVIFDKNPDHEFYVEESFPLDWMYPYLTPYGIIMKINRQPLAEFSQPILDKDHSFWSQYSTRTIGNWITYDTSVKDVCAFAEKMYLRRDFDGFKGDSKFIRDDDAQKAFSKLRSSIGGIYEWRAEHPANPADQQRMLKEADFAFKQAFAFCPFSPEAVYRYAQLLTGTGRMDDAILIAETCSKLDPHNDQIKSLAANLKAAKKRAESPLNAVFAEIGRFIANKQTNEAEQRLSQLLAMPEADPTLLMSVAQASLQMGNYALGEKALARMAQLNPESPEVWYNLAGLVAAQGKAPQSIEYLRKALQLNDKQLSTNPNAPNLREYMKTDGNFAAIRETPEFKALLSEKK